MAATPSASNLDLPGQSLDEDGSDSIQQEAMTELVAKERSEIGRAQC